LKSQEFFVETVETAIECHERMIQGVRSNVLILETFLLWGGSDGVLAVREADDRLKSISVIVIDVSRDPNQAYRIGVYSVADYWMRYPSSQELRNAIHGLHVQLAPSTQMCQ
jgi:hypothetical protein